MPPKPKPLIAARRGSFSPRRIHGSFWRKTRNGLPSRAIFGPGWRKFDVCGNTPRSMASRVLIKLAPPAAVSRWPMLAFTAPSTHWPGRLATPRQSSARLANSTASPTGVPVAWHSIKSTWSGDQPAWRYARRNARNWPSELGESKLPSRSLDRPMPRIIARMWSPSRNASERRFSTTNPAPSPTIKPLAAASNGAQRPEVASARNWQKPIWV